MSIRLGTSPHRSRHPWIPILFLLAVLAPASLYSQTPTEKVKGRKAAAGEVLVKFRPLGPGYLASIVDEHDLVLARRIGGVKDMYRLRARNKDVPTLMKRLAAHPHVIYVEPNYVLQAVDTPNDTLFDQLWGLHNTGQSIVSLPGTAGADIDAVLAWGISTGSGDNVVAVVDTGIDYTHPDLAANIW